MADTSRIMLFICTLTSQLLISSAQTCSDYTFVGNEVFDYCTQLPVLQAYLHWNYTADAGKVQIAYRAAQTPTGWVAWAINPTGIGMVGSQALVAFRNSSGSMTAYTTQIMSYNPSMEPGELTIPVSDISAEYVNNEMIIFAVLGPLGDETSFNHVWQAGSNVSHNIPQVHPLTGQNVVSVGQLDFRSPYE